MAILSTFGADKYVAKSGVLIMRLFALLLLSCLTCLTCLGQPGPIPLRSVDAWPANTPTISQNSLAYWWVASDLPVGVTVSNQWTDRIQGMLSQANTDPKPTNSATGVFFDASKPNSLTNNIANLGAPQVYAWWLVVKPTGTISDHQFIFCQTGTDASEISIKSSGFMAGTANNNITAAITAGQVYDVFVISTNNTGQYVAIYTNGVTGTIGAQSTSDNVVHRWQIWGTDQSHNTALSYHGYIVEIAYYTNYFPTAADIVKNHARSKALYGNGP